MQTIEITAHDIELMSQLLQAGLSAELIAEKFETVESEVIQRVYPPERYIKPQDYLSRARRGTLRVGEDSIEKRCSRCRQYLPLNHDFFHHCKGTKDGYLSWCRPCEIERNNARRK
ncbi:hypothetical protein DDM60_002652 [Vibrio cholerae]|uniref:Uncharacterized protein n=1 Tax=Vibrio cholerae TaxID=666 RepID=A0A7Z7YC30_VIBCL|nr:MULTISPECIES: hypothetical protein [Vibrio]EGQ9107537.1 hypothetical protein [Vibrio cholerae]ELJ8564037.1 hypothetical protein [Vibrio cholerae]QIL87148.1 hypothetical protein G7083_14730 [Vibrio sp. HDW18]TBM39775.1 hypothetical protein EYB64_16175 [Vibrio cholerae]